MKKENHNLKTGKILSLFILQSKTACFKDNHMAEKHLIQNLWDYIWVDTLQQFMRGGDGRNEGRLWVFLELAELDAWKAILQEGNVTV